jgi:hypothetical protein
VMIGALSLTQQQDLTAGWADIQTGVALTAKGLAVFAGILGPIALALWARWTAKPAQQKANVGLLPNTMVVTLNPTGIPETDTVKTTRVAASIATMPEVKNVISTPQVSAATASDKVVSGTDKVMP